VDSHRRAPSWLKATVRGALIATAVGGGLFVLSQVLAPSQAHAETAHAATSSVRAETDDSLLGPALGDAGRALGNVTHMTDDIVGGATGSVAAVAQPAAGTVSAAASSVVDALPPAVQAPVKQVEAPAAHTVRAVTAPVAQNLSSAGAAKPIGAVVGAVSGVADRVISGVERVPVVGGTVSGIAGQNPVSTVLSPAAANLDNTVANAADTANGAVSPTTAGPDSGVTEGGSCASSEVGSGATAEPFGPVTGLPHATRQHRPVAPSTPADAAATSALGGAAPGLPGTVQPPAFAPSGVGAGSAAGGGSGGGAPTQAAAAASFYDFPASLAGAASLDAGGALPASPVFENDSTPD